MRLFFGPGRRLLLDGSLARGGKLAEFVLVHRKLLSGCIRFNIPDIPDLLRYPVICFSMRCAVTVLVLLGRDISTNRLPVNGTAVPNRLCG
jgi:hypothetical protein